MTVATQGIVFSRADPDDVTSPLTYNAVGRVVSFEGPGGKASEIDTTDLSSEAKEFMIGIPDEGSFSFELNLDPADAQQNALRDDRADRALRSFKLQLTDDDNTALYFDGYVMEFRISGRQDSIVKANVSIRISGPVQYDGDEA